MDKRIDFLDNLKKQLDPYRSEEKKEEININQTKPVPHVNYSRLRAQMLLENVQIGIVFNDTSLYDAGVYAEYVGNKMIFHCYPLMSEKKVKHTENSEKVKDSKKKLVAVKKI